MFPFRRQGLVSDCLGAVRQSLEFVCSYVVWCLVEVKTADLHDWKVLLNITDYN